MAYSITETQATKLLKIAAAIVGKHVKTAFISETDRADYIQELMSIMVEHQDDWDIPEGVSFETFAHTVMKKRLISIWRKKHKKSNIMADSCSLNTLLIDDDGEESEVIDFLTSDGMVLVNNNHNWRRQRLIAEIRLFVNELPSDEHELCNLLMYYSQAEAAKILKINRKTLWNMVQRIKNKMILAGIYKFSKNF